MICTKEMYCRCKGNFVGSRRRGLQVSGLALVEMYNVVWGRKLTKRSRTRACHTRPYALAITHFRSYAGSERRGSSVTFDVTHIFGRRKLSSRPLRPAFSNFNQPSLPRSSSLDPGSNPAQGSKYAAATRQIQLRERVVRGVISPYFLDPRRKFGLHLQ